MEDRTQHHHKCWTPGCQEVWTCYRSDCDPHELCEVCEQKRFEEFHDARGFTVSQPTIPELEEEPTR